MSLDLDADVLITETAPISALVQRFGRANRHLARGDEFRATLHVIPPPSNAPYTRPEIQGAEAFLRSLGARDVSQRDLADALEVHIPGERVSDGSSRFMDAGYYATPGAFRDLDEFTKPCLLDSDMPEVERRIARHDPIDGYVVAVPRSDIRQDWPRSARLPRWLGIAAGDQYDPERGFLAVHSGSSGS
jgi:CRISPR-associated endonuclease/helicase Cas3